MKAETLASKRRTIDRPISALAVERVRLSLVHESGVLCRALYREGESVRAGQLIAVSLEGAIFQLRMHAPIDGVLSRLDDDGITLEATTDRGPSRGGPPGRSGQNPHPLLPRARQLHAETPAFGCLDAADIIGHVREAGILEAGGAGLPTYLKLTPAPGSPVDTVLINACESEPFLTADYRVLVERAPEVADGLALAREALGAEAGCVVAPGELAGGTMAIEALLTGGADRVQQLWHEGVLGYEKTLIREVLGRIMPRGKLARDAGVVVLNVQTAAAISRAVRHGTAVTSRILTVSGAGIGRAGNYEVPLGTAIGTILEAAGWRPEATATVVLGGPMMGRAVDDLASPIRKGTAGVLALGHDETRRPAESVCLRCGACAAACPVDLVPARVHRLARPAPGRLQALHVEYCVECGECDAACPSGIELTRVMRLAKSGVASWLKGVKG